MTLSPAGIDALRRLLISLLPEEEAAIVTLRHTEGEQMTWVQIGQQLGMHPLRADRLYRKALRRLRQPARLLTRLMLEAPTEDR